MINRDSVDHPSHYKQENKKECIDEMVEKFGLKYTCVFCLMNAYKYLYRAGFKQNNSEEQDLEKAKWYINWVHSRPIYKEEDNNFESLYSEVLKMFLERKKEDERDEE